MTGNSHVLRRAVLASVGALTTAGVATAHDDCKREKEKRCKKDRWYESTITVANHSKCARKVEFRVSGKLSKYKREDQPERLDSGVSLFVPSRGEKTLYFTGSVRHLDSEHGTISITIDQHSEHHAHHCP